MLDASKLKTFYDPAAVYKLLIVAVNLHLFIPTATKGPDDSCAPEQYECQTDHTCIPASYQCDGEPDCADSSDERGCSKFHTNSWMQLPALTEAELFFFFLSFHL